MRVYVLCVFTCSFNDILEETMERCPSPFEPQTAGSNESATVSPQHEGTTPSSGEDKVYTVATDRTINKLMSQYKKRKQLHTLPTFVKASKSNRSSSQSLPQNRPFSTDPDDRQIEEQQRCSILKVADTSMYFTRS